MVLQLFENMDVNKQAPNMEEVKQYREKYCPTPTWCHFSSCNIYFHHPLHSMWVSKPSLVFKVHHNCIGFPFAQVLKLNLSHGCNSYTCWFPCSNPDTQVVAAITLRRLALEVLMHEGSVSETINQHVTHVVVYTDPESPVQYKTILQRLESNSNCSFYRS
jgi:hypothetical protein